MILYNLKLFCIRFDSDLLPKENGGICLCQETTDGRPILPSNTPYVRYPHAMRSFDNVFKDLASFVSLWDMMANEDLLGEFQRKNKPLEGSKVRSCFAAS